MNFFLINIYEFYIKKQYYIITIYNKYISNLGNMLWDNIQWDNIYNILYILFFLIIIIKKN